MAGSNDEFAVQILSVLVQVLPTRGFHLTCDSLNSMLMDYLSCDYPSVEGRAMRSPAF